VQFLASGTHPVVWGVGPDVPGAPTLLLYGHYDVQPPDPLAEWTTPPFRADGARRQAVRPRLGGRQGTGVLPPQGVRGDGSTAGQLAFLIEGEEEHGSRVLFELLRREPERTRADLVLIADMSYVAPKWPAVYTTLRGLCYAEITVRTAKSDLHSGEFGGAAPMRTKSWCDCSRGSRPPTGRSTCPVSTPPCGDRARRSSRRGGACRSKRPSF